ncbi:DNA cytosine methyltransferase [Gulosibacter sediminis]|uniref:DNA cytosine methyltransferase n=1 Tax=Gulosibacter sediminis TaxID=1729695 RepID=UPI0024A7C898|nr:DNA (cytosine-5-)-methyltransferase [Gulosibacter sediminis]
MDLRLGELFAGYGGLGLGVEQALAALGHRAERAWVSEFDPAPSRILAHHWPDVPNLGDITRIDWTQVPPVDVLTGGFPCQDVSLAGARAGMRDGTRSGLWSYMAAAIAALRPRLVVIENVRGLLSAPAGKEHDADLEPCPICVGDDRDSDLRALGAVLGDLADLGFDAEWGLLEAADVGATHRRARVFIITWPTDADGDILGQHGSESPTQEAGAHDSHGSTNLDRGSGPNRLMPTPEAALGSRGGASDPAKRREAGHSVSLADAVHVLPTPRASRGASQTETAYKLGGERSDKSRTQGRVEINSAGFGEYAPAVARWEAVTGRPAPAPTEPGVKGGSRLSARFVEWMMGLPEGHVTNTGITRAAQLKALGNGVVPQQAAAAVTELLRRAAA